MKVVAKSVAGIDVHQKQITVTILIGEANETEPRPISRRFGTITAQLRECGEWLKSHKVAQVLMESTGQYWRPVWQVLETFGFKMILCNPRFVKNMPGKKTDQKDSEWLSELARYGLVSASFVPPKAIQELRESTRLRKKIIESTTRIKNEIHNILQRSNIKLTTYISDIYSGSGLKIINLLLNGEKISLRSVSKCMDRRIKSTPEQVFASLDGVLSYNDHFLMRLNFDLLTKHQNIIDELSARIVEQTAKFSDLSQRLQDIPGISQRTAEIVLAEVGSDVSPFPDAHHLASWAGLCPGNHESAGVSHGSKTRHGNSYLRPALLTSAVGAKATNKSGLKDYYWRLTSRMGEQKAKVALAHKLLRIIYVLIKTGQTYQEYQKDQRVQITLAK